MTYTFDSIEEEVLTGLFTGFIGDEDEEDEEDADFDEDEEEDLE